MNSLRDFYAAQLGRASDKWSLYLDVYEEQFRPWRASPVRMLEIGIQNGGSLDIWPRYFAAGQLFIGCDINPDCRVLTYPDPRVHVVVGDANTDAVEAEIAAVSSEFDIVIDDGSHTSVDIVRTFARYFPKVVDGGLFVAEDLHCSYWGEFGGGLHHPHSSMSFFKLLVDVMHHEHWGVPAKRQELIAGFRDAYGIECDDQLLAGIHSIVFANSLCFIRKRPAAENVLGNRWVAGSEEPVVQGLLARRGLPHIAPSQAGNAFSTTIRPPAERLQLIQHEFDAGQAALARLQRDRGAAFDQGTTAAEQLERALSEATSARLDAERRLGELEAQRQLILGSRSWRWTAPMRQLAHPAGEGGSGSVVPSLLRHGFLLLEGARRAVASGQTARVLSESARVAIKHGPRRWLSEVRRYVEGSGTLPGRVAPEREEPPWAEYREWIDSVESRLPAPPAQPRGMVSVIVPVCNTPVEFMKELVASLRAQTYPEWELCLHDDASDREWVRPMLEELRASMPNVRLSFGDERRGISAASNAALAMAQGRWVAFVDHDDVLHPHALAACVDTLIEQGAGLAYTDHDLLDAEGRRCAPLFKPDWSLDLLLAQMYIGHLLVAERLLVTAVGQMNSGMDGAQDYDLVLRCVSEGAKIAHVPRVLYHWRQHAGSTAANAESKPYAHHAGRRALQAWVDRTHPGCRVDDGDQTFCYDVRYLTPQFRPSLVSIIIPTRDRLDLLRTCVDTLYAQTCGVPFELIVVDNGSVEPATHAWLNDMAGRGRLRVLAADVPFNWSVLNNLAAGQAQGDVLVFLNNDTEIVRHDWLARLCEVALRPDVGCVGPMLTYGDGTIQHAGVVVGMGGWADHVFKGAPVAHVQRYYVSPVLRRNVLAVTGACMAIQTTKFFALGGFDESFVICGSDVEICLRAHAAGLRNVFVPESSVVHHESKTRDPRAIPEQDFVRSAQAYEPYRSAGDPFYNPNLDKMSTTPVPGAAR